MWTKILRFRLRPPLIWVQYLFTCTKTQDIVDNFAFKFTTQNNFSEENYTNFTYTAKLLISLIDGAGILDLM